MNNAKELLHLSDEERIRVVLTEKFIRYPMAQEILDHIEFLALQPPQTRAWGLGIVAPPGAGKTVLAKALVRQLTSAAEEGNQEQRQIMPVVSISMTGAREARTIDARILEALGSPQSFQMVAKPVEREQQVMRLLREARTKLLIVDEIQDVLTSTERQQRIALDHIKLIMNTAGIPVVVLGIQSAIEAMQVDPHLAERFDWKLLPIWKCDDETRDLLNALESVLPLREPSHLASQEKVRLLVKKSNGVLARLVRIINNAAVFAIMEKTERITEGLIEKACISVPTMKPRGCDHVTAA